MSDRSKKQKKNDPNSGNGPSRGPCRRDGNKERKNNKKTRRGKPKASPKDIFDMDPQPRPKKQKKDVASGFDDIISTEYLQWLEHTARQAGYDTTGARAYFDGDSREHPEEDFRQCAAEWYDDVKYTFGFDVGWFEFQMRWG
jgi:hypothetical protein